MSLRKPGLWLICILALAQFSPARVREWAYASGSLRPIAAARPVIAPAPLVAADLDQDGAVETLLLTAGRAEIWSAGSAVWHSPSAWQVTQASVTDLNNDGQPEVALLVWRPFKPWPIDRYLAHPGRIRGFHDAPGNSCHLILIRWKRGSYRELWAGSAMAEPFRAFAAADLDGDARQELIALEGDYADPRDAPARALSVWEWNGFGFTVLARVPGPFHHVVVATAPDGRRRILTQE